MEENKAASVQETSAEEVVHSRPRYEQKILEIIRTVNSPKLLRDKLDDYHANDIAEAFSELTQFEREKLYRMLGTERLTEILEYMDEDDSAKFLSEMNIRKTIAIINEMETDKAADLLKEIDKEKREIILELLEPEVRKRFRSYSPTMKTKSVRA
ncbi:hypothetical protein [Allobaculum sp. Allo2]|uniref:magnesium transporter MgtE N-terminal domain-containing protein n=1 Tax=Allobaculum sp. Allo2 TaxID=2853432 RepID=UPI001F61DF80|nr:hypothetical protein [Allobaculum sp. Allo2]